MKRNRPGTKKKELFKWGNGEKKLDELESVYATREYIQDSIRRVGFDKIDDIVILDEELKNEKDGWIYEHFRQLLQELDGFILNLKEVCTKETQPEMKLMIPSKKNPEESEETIFLCAAFNPAELVPAIDYMVHTLNQATSALSDISVFPNRSSLSKQGKKEIKTHARRIYRIFLFSYYAHNKQFKSHEEKYHLCARYTKFVRKYKLMSKEDLSIPSKAIKIKK